MSSADTDSVPVVKRWQMWLLAWDTPTAVRWALTNIIKCLVPKRNL